MAETAITGNKTKHYIYLDVVRIVAVITAAAHLLGFLETGWAAVCTLLMIAGYAAARNAFANRKYSLWRGLLSAVVRVYMPLAAVAGLVTIAASRFPQILWLSERHETASVFFGINNFWQLSAGRDAINGLFESPFTHMWAAAVLLQFAVLFPFLFLILRWTGKKLGRAVPCWALIFLAAAGLTAFGLLERSSLMTAYYDSFARFSAPFLGMALAFIQHYYGTLIPRFARGKGVGIPILIIYLALWTYVAVFAGEDPVWSFICGRFGVGTSDTFVRILMISLISFRLLDYAALCSEAKKKPAKMQNDPNDEQSDLPQQSAPAAFGAAALGLSYEFYLLITPLAFFAPYVLSPEYEPIRKIILIVGGAVLAGALMHIAAGLKEDARAIAVRIPLFVLCLAAAGYGCLQFVRLDDPAASLSELSAKLAQNEAALEAQNKSFESKVRASEEAWSKIYEGFEAERAEVPGIVTQLPLTCLGDSVMVGSTAKLKALFPNAYVDAKVGDTAYPALAKLKTLNAKGTLGSPVVLNYGANGDVAESVKNSIMDQIGDRPVYWLTNTYHGRLYLNDVLYEYAEKHPNIRVVDWYGYTKDHPEYFVADGLHPTAEGQEAFARLVYEAISGDYLAEIQQREDAQREDHELEKLQRVIFVGNDLLSGAFPQISKTFKSAGYMVISNDRFTELAASGSSGFAVLKTKLQAAMEDGSLPQRVVLMFDAMSGFGAKEYRELAELLSGRELHIVRLNGTLMATPGSRSAGTITAGTLKGLGNADIIEFTASDATRDMLYADRIHLTEEGNYSLAELISQTVAAFD